MHVSWKLDLKPWSEILLFSFSSNELNWLLCVCVTLAAYVAFTLRSDNLQNFCFPESLGSLNLRNWDAEPIIAVRKYSNMYFFQE